MPGPVICDGKMYYPAKPGATYYNEPPDYTTNLPPLDAVSFVNVVSTNHLIIHLIDGHPIISTNDTAVHFINGRFDEHANFSTNPPPSISNLY